MIRDPHALRWLPPLLVGVCAATSAEVAVGLLLYGGPGLMRSLTAVLAVEAAALGVGFLTAPGTRPDLVETLRRRWLFALAAYLAATVFSAFWSVVELVGGSALGQGLGLAFLAALPLYATGALLGAMGTFGGTSEGGVRGVGGAAALGAALGFATTGASLPQVLSPASLLLVCLVLLSAGGLVYGAVLDARLRVHVRARRPSPSGDVRVEDRHLPSRDRAARLLLEGEHLRRWLLLGDEPDGEAWEAAVYRGLGDPPGGGDDVGSVLFLGGGASSLPRVVATERRSARVDVVERSQGVVELGREHLETGLHPGPDGRPAVMTGNLEDAMASLEGSYRLVLVDTRALAPQGGVSSLSLRGRDDLVARVASDGVVALGPLAPGAGSWEAPPGWSLARYARPLPEGLADLDIPAPPREELLLASPTGERPWPQRLGSFAREAEAGP